jgi:hypothetical protein
LVRNAAHLADLALSASRATAMGRNSEAKTQFAIMFDESFVTA